MRDWTRIRAGGEGRGKGRAGGGVGRRQRAPAVGAGMSPSMERWIASLSGHPLGARRAVRGGRSPPPPAAWSPRPGARVQGHARRAPAERRVGGAPPKRTADCRSTGVTCPAGDGGLLNDAPRSHGGGWCLPGRGIGRGRRPTHARGGGRGGEGAPDYVSPHRQCEAGAKRGVRRRALEQCSLLPPQAPGPRGPEEEGEEGGGDAYPVGRGRRHAARAPCPTPPCPRSWLLPIPHALPAPLPPPSPAVRTPFPSLPLPRLPLQEATPAGLASAAPTCPLSTKRGRGGRGGWEMVRRNGHGDDSETGVRGWGVEAWW